MRSWERERRTTMRKDSNITRRAMGITVSVKRTVIPILWLTRTYRAMVSIVRVNRPRGVEDQVLILSAC